MPGLAFLLCLAFMNRVSAQTGDVGVFIAQGVHESDTAMEGLGAAVVEALWRENASPRKVSLARPPSPLTREELEEVRGLGSTAIAELAEGKASEEMLAKYDLRITRALAFSHSVHDSESRAVLWNICLLRVQLYLRSASKDVQQKTEAAIHDCRTRFVDQLEFSQAWSSSVAEAFQRHAEEHPKVQLELRSAPAACEAFLYGAAVGTTPLRLQVVPGRQEIQLVCHGRPSRLHGVALYESAEFEIWLAADEALVDHAELVEDPVSRLTQLRYLDLVALKNAAEHALALAREAHFASFALIQSDGRGMRIDWFHGGVKEASVHVPAGSSEQQTQLAITRLLHPSELPNDALAPKKRSSRRTFADYLLGGGLMAIGGGLMIYPLQSFMREGDCADTNCMEIYRGKTPLSMGLLGVGTALIGAGAVVMMLGPFGARQHFALTAGANSLELRGSF